MDINDILKAPIAELGAKVDSFGETVEVSLTVSEATALFASIQCTIEGAPDSRDDDDDFMLEAAKGARGKIVKALGIDKVFNTED